MAAQFTRQNAHDLAAKIFNDLREMTPDTVGVSRPAYSDIETKTLDYLSDLARSYGLIVTEDRAKNRWFCRPIHASARAYVTIGSHVDSVPEGGNFDGLAGVVAGFLALIEAEINGIDWPRPVKVLAMRGEESAWFGACYLGSKALTGTMPTADLNAPHKSDGRPLYAHMQDQGIDTKPIFDALPLMDLSEIAEYIELHIEQGPLLVERKLPAAVVTGIRGNFRYRAIRCIGEGGHSGAVPRAYRHDPVLAMADLLTRLDDSWLHILQTGGDLVLTSGVVGTDPSRHAIARIADEISFSLDIRSQNQEVLDHMQDYLAQEMAEISRIRGVQFETGPLVPAAPALMDAALVSRLLDAMAESGQEPFAMPSGAGHDAAVFAGCAIPSAMIFVRNANGSHNPAEAMEIDDFLLGVAIISAYLKADAP